MKNYRAGAYLASEVPGSSLRLDGGAMFGVVPRVLWEKASPPDARNRIHLSAHPLLLEHEETGRRILVEAGTSFEFSEKEMDIYGIAGRGLLGDLADLGVAPEEIDLVIMSHLHFDHAGGLVTSATEGGLRPAFPRARIVVQKGELEDGLDPEPIRRASYRSEDLRLLQEAGLFETVDGEAEVAPGIVVEPVKGHTERHQVIRVGEGEGALVFVGDLVPTAAHVNPAWLMAYDLFPRECARNRRAVLDRAVEQGWVLYFYHDPGARARRVRRNERGAFELVAI